MEIERQVEARHKAAADAGEDSYESSDDAEPALKRTTKVKKRKYNRKEARALKK